MRLIRGACLAGLLLPAAAQAQVVNWDFSAGPSSWEWRRGQDDWGPFDNCFGQMDTYNVSAAYDTPSIGTEPAIGRVGELSPSTPSDGRWYVCKQIQQAVVVPVGSMLTFDARLGSVYTDGLQIHPVWLWVEVVDGEGESLGGRALEGTSKTSNCEYSNACPEFHRFTVDVTQAWDKLVSLRIRAKSVSVNSFGGLSEVASTAFVDNVRFVTAPPPAAPRMGVPAISGNNHSVSWDATEHTTSYVLEQSVDNGAWNVIYNGLDTGWTMMSAPSGDYRYRAKACGNGCSAYSSEVLVNVPQATPGTPSAIVVGRTFDLSWGASSGAVRYVLEQKGQDGLWVTSYDGPATQTKLVNISPGIYGYRVKACGAVVCSTYSAEQYFTAVDVTPVIVDYLL